MQLYAHAVVSLPFAFAVLNDQDIFCSSLVLVGALFPDFMDGALAKSSGKDFYSIHRTVSHWIFTYLFFLFWTDYGLFFIGGILLHLICDLCTPMGIPLAPFYYRNKRFRFVFGLKKRSSLDLIKNKSLREKYIAFIFFGLFLLQFFTLKLPYLNLNELKKIIYNYI